MGKIHLFQKKPDLDLEPSILSGIKEYALYAVNLNGQIIYFGLGAEAIFGWRKNEILTKPLSVLHLKKDSILPPEFILDKLRELGKYEAEVYLVKKDGRQFLAALSATKLLDSHKESIGYRFMAKDISEIKRAQRQVFQAEKVAALRQLAVGLGDEINNLLVVLSGRLAMILEQEGITKETRENLEIVDNCAARLRKVAGQIFKFTKNLPQKFENLNINEVIESVFTLLAYHKLPPVVISLEKDLAPGLPPVKGDFKQLQEAFLDLLLNAYQSMPAGGKLTIKTSNSGNQHIEIRVTDTGLASAKKEWTGLDLLICYNIINNLNGSLDIESQADQGTTFVIRLPLV